MDNHDCKSEWQCRGFRYSRATLLILGGLHVIWHVHDIFKRLETSIVILLAVDKYQKYQIVFKIKDYLSMLTKKKNLT